MATSLKIIQKASMRMEAGKQPAAATGWGGASSAQALSSIDGAISHYGLEIKPVIDNVADAAIEGQAFSDIPQMAGKHIGASWSGPLKFTGLDILWYWMFGWERPGYSPLTMCRFTVSGMSVDPTAGATYTNNSSTFTVKSTSLTAHAGYLYCQRTAGSNAPTGDTLTKTGGTGDATVTFSANSGIYYSHLFELDRNSRDRVAYASDEQTAGDYDASDRKNRAATIGKIMGTNDFRYRNSLCAKFGIKSEAGGKASWSCDIVAYDEARGSYDSANWDFPSGAAGSTYDILHRQWNVAIGPSGSLVDVGVTSFEINATIPLAVEQDTESGLYRIEPVLSGGYDVSASLTLSRHSVDTYLAYRDDWSTALCAKFEATYGTTGNYNLGFYLPDVRIQASEVSNEDVARNPITLVCGKEPGAGNPFTTECKGHSLIQKGFLFAIADNQNSTNEMRRE